jgi:hypothetical protein
MRLPNGREQGLARNEFVTIQHQRLHLKRRDAVAPLVTT